MFPVVDPYRTRLHQGNALHTALASEFVYYMDETGKPNGELILSELLKYDPDYISVTGVSNKSSQAAFIEHDRFVMYAFTGTQEMADWLDNLNVFSDEKLGGEVHRGFYYAWHDIWEELSAIYWEKRRIEKRPVIITGHSLGAAMGNICVQKFLLEDWPFTAAYLYGSPRCLQKKTARIFNIEARDKVFRFQNRTDIVTRIPARMMGYSHCGTSLFCDNDGCIQTDPGWWQMFVDRVEARIDDIKEMSLRGVADHNMQEYRKVIQRWNLRD